MRWRTANNRRRRQKANGKRIIDAIRWLLRPMVTAPMIHRVRVVDGKVELDCVDWPIGY